MQYLAERLTWGELQTIERHGGVRHFEATTGCGHQCIGCMVRCDIGKKIKRMTWDNFKRSLRALSGLQTAISEISKRKHRLFNEEWLGLYFGSDPMNNSLADSITGKKVGPVEQMQLVHKETGKASDIWTAGWSPKNAVLEDSARRMVADIMADRAPYVGALQLEIKTHTAEFKREAEKHMTNALRSRAGFMTHFGADFEKFGFQFEKYAKPREAREIYYKLGSLYFDDVIAQSKYIQYRIENLKTLLPAINKKGGVVFYWVSAAGASAQPEVLKPFMNPDRLYKLINERYLNHGLNRNKVDYIRWNFNTPRIKEAGKADLLTAVIKQNGSIAIDTQTANRYFMNKSPDPHVRSLAGRPVLFPDDRQSWQIALDRLDTTNDPFLSDTEKASIRERIIQMNPGLQEANVKLGKNVQYITWHEKSDVPVVDVKINGVTQRFNFDGGTLIPATSGLSSIPYRKGCLGQVLRLLKY